MAWLHVIESSEVGPPNSKSIAVKEFWFRPRGIQGPDIWRNLCKFLVAIFPEIRIKIDENSRTYSPKLFAAFSSVF